MAIPAILEKWRFKNEWGVSDEDLYEMAFDKIWSKNDKPTLSVLLTMSNHGPFEVTKEFEKSHPEIKDKKELAFLYSDYALGKFLDKCSEYPEYKNTIFLIVADHGEIYDDSDWGVKRFHIPALLLNCPDSLKTFSKTCSQIDFAPTILYELGYNNSFHCIGQNLFAKDYLPIAFFRDYGTGITFCKDSIAMRFDVRDNKPEYFYMDKTKHKIEASNLSDSLKSEMKKFSENYLQTISFIYRHGRYRFGYK